jgi:site-specific DNA-methyltransferase (adenine-specific)
MLTPGFRLHQEDAVNWLSRLPSGSVDLIITDPPYESLEKHRAIGTTTRLKQSKASSNQWFEIFPNDRFSELFTQVYRVLARDSHFYMFCDAETMFIAKPLAEAAGFRFWKPLVWDKVSIGMGYHYRARHEFILFFEKGKRRLKDLGVADVLTAKRVHRGYPTEKPVELLKTLVMQSAEPGQVVADPFMGSGSTGVAAIQHGCSFLGNDLCLEACEVTRKRLSDAIGLPLIEPVVECVDTMAGPQLVLPTIEDIAS